MKPGETDYSKGSFPRIWNSTTFRNNFDEINWSKKTICDGCHNEIDPECCHCGTAMDRHDVWDGHSPVPMGCVCGYADPKHRAELSHKGCDCPKHFQVPQPGGCALEKPNKQKPEHDNV